MKKLIILSLLTLITVPAAADTMFGGKENQVSLNSAAGVNFRGLIALPGQFAPFGMLQLNYSQPNTFFRILGRQTLSISGTRGVGKAYGWNWQDLKNVFISASQDISLYETSNWYYGTGVGVGLQKNTTSRVSSLLLLQFKLFIGRKITDSLNAEVFFQHFSNGRTTEENRSYNFYGIGMAYNF